MYTRVYSQDVQTSVNFEDFRKNVKNNVNTTLSNVKSVNTKRVLTINQLLLGWSNFIILVLLTNVLGGVIGGAVLNLLENKDKGNDTFIGLTGFFFIFIFVTEISFSYWKNRLSEERKYNSARIIELVEVTKDLFHCSFGTYLGVRLFDSYDDINLMISLFLIFTITVLFHILYFKPEVKVRKVLETGL